MVLLVSSDSEQFFVDKDVAERSALIRKLLRGKNASPRLSPGRTLSDHTTQF
jgi:hypothetical protein